MLQLPEVRRLLESPEVREVESRFVSAHRRKGNFPRKSNFSLAKFIELLLNDLTFEEVGEKLGMGRFSVAGYYERYCRDLACFKGESGMERRERIYTARTEKKIRELRCSWVEDPLLAGLSAKATEMGCVVTPVVFGEEHGHLGISSRRLNIDGKNCQVHKITYVNRVHGGSRIGLELKPETILEPDVRIICVRAPGVAKGDYPIPASVIANKFLELSGRRVLLTLKEKGPRSKALDIRSYLNGFKRIKHFA
jgi:hypothetical protein